ncbi:MAG: hypothetical protein V4563_13030 [Pseudomonadota bacterium]
MELPDTLVNALYESLLTPTKDKEGHTVYALALNLAADLRMAIKQAQQHHQPPHPPPLNYFQK